jgi:hypothetical protein
MSALFYAIDYLSFGALRSSMGFYTLLDIAFIPLNVLIVGLFINKLIQARERQELLHKMNMVIGAFFSQTGSELIAALAAFDADVDDDREHMLFKGTWTAADFGRHREAVRGDHHAMSLAAGDLEVLRDLMKEQRPFVLGLLQNGNLLEHASFADMLWAVSHLSEELTARRDLGALSESDVAHLQLDMARAYGRLLGEWLLYVRHLKEHYPYLFAFAVRTNPFDPTAIIEVSA